MLIKVYIIALRRFPIFSFNSQRVGTPIINERTGISVLCYHGKRSSYIPTSKVIGLAVMGKYISERLMLINLAFLMACKYMVHAVTYFSNLFTKFEYK